MTNDFGERVGLLLAIKGMRPIDLARRASVDKSTVSKWMAGKTPTMSNAALVAEIFEYPSISHFYADSIERLRRLARRAERDRAAA